MREVGAFEARSKLGQLLDLVEHGEEVMITAMAKWSRAWCPCRSVNREAARAALDQELRIAARPA